MSGIQGTLAAESVSVNDVDRVYESSHLAWPRIMP